MGKTLVQIDSIRSSSTMLQKSWSEAHGVGERVEVDLADSHSSVQFAFRVAYILRGVSSRKK